MATQAEIEATLKLKDELSAKLKNVESSIQGVTGKNAGMLSGLANTQISFKAVAAAGAVVVGAVAAIGAAMGSTVKSVIDFADPLNDLALKTQTSVMWLQEMRIAASQVGVPLDTVANSALKLQQNIGKAGEITKETRDALDALGLSFQSLKSLSPEKQFEEVARAIAGVQNPAEQASIAMALFGRQGVELLPIIRSDFAAVTAEAQALGIILDDKVVAASERMGDRFTLLGQAVSATSMQIGGAIVQSQGFQAAVEFLISAIGQLNQWIIANQGEIKTWVTAGILVAASAIQGTLTFVGLFVSGLGLLGETVLQVNKFFIDLSITLLKSPFAALVPGALLFRKELLGIAESMGKNIETGTKFFQGVQELGQSIDQAGIKVGDFRANILNQISAGEQYRNTLSTVTKETDTLAKATSAAWPEVAMLGAQFRDLKASSPELAIPNEAAEKYADLLPIVTQRQGGLSEGIFETTGQTLDWGSAMDGVNDILSEARGFMTLLGVSADSAFGKILGWVSKAFDAFNSLTGVIGKIAGLFGAGGGGGIGSLLGLGGSAAGAAGGGGGLLGLLGIGGGAAGAAGAGGAGAAAAGAGAAGGGGGLLSGLGGLLTNPITGIVAGIGAAAFFGIKALLKKGSAETTAEFLGIDFDAISKDLQSRLQDMGKQIGDFSTALQLNLGQVFAEGGIANIDSFAEKMADTFSFLDREQIDAAQAQKILGETVQQLLPNIAQMGAAGVQQLERLLAAADRTGVSFAGIDELAAAYVARANELGVAVNNVVLESLGLQGALATAAGPVARAAVPLPGAVPSGAAGEAVAMQANAFTDAAPEIGQAAGDTISKQLQPELKGIKDEVNALGKSIEASIARAVRDAVQMGQGAGG